MQTSSQPKLLPIPFADAGSKQDIPNDSQVGITAGRASYNDGFPPLTRTPLAAGGVPPFGTDFNGVLNDITAAVRWSQAGAGYPFNTAFNTAVSGYPKGARIPNSTLDGFWLNTTDGNSANPENTTAAITGWVPSGSYGATAITGLSGSSITLTSLQASKDRITLAGALTANVNVIVPAWVKKWDVINNCTGAFSVTVKTPSGTGVALASGQTATVIGDGTNVKMDAPPVRLAKLTSSGSFTVPSGVTTLYVSGCAGGGGGGGGSSSMTSSSASTCGGGGGAGESTVKAPIAVTSGQVINYIIGGAGTGGNGGATGSSGSSGTSGGNTTFGSLLTLTGGAGGGGGNYGTATVSGGAPGVGYPNGGAGMSSVVTGSNFVMYSLGGAGGGTAYGGGGPAGMGAGGTATAGVSAFGYGAAGGGGGTFIATTGGSSTGLKGGNGAPGLLIIEW
ncbi:glycine-rich domain-containing protein [Pantoea trifolii]|uniref:glycine-rich domain-containing protein n=1 Tax=Candidatus Pantoea symbiotica TaxID=1884370 RepID=UPI0024130018|nr:hypothetical protein [Pantoea rodasii]